MAALDERKRLDARALTVIAEGTAGLVILHSTLSGHIMCRACHQVWCDHISNSVMEVRDSASIFADLDRVEPVNTLVVPVIPTENIFGDIWLRHYRDKMIWKAYLLEPGETGNRNHADAQFLGFFHRGEGRLHLRQLIIQHFLPSVNDPRFPNQWTRCSSSQHSRKQQEFMRQECSNKSEVAGRKFAHMWCITWFRKCYNCYANEGPSAKFDPELIPDM